MALGSKCSARFGTGTAGFNLVRLQKIVKQTWVRGRQARVWDLGNWWRLHPLQQVQLRKMRSGLGLSLGREWAIRRRSLQLLEHFEAKRARRPLAEDLSRVVPLNRRSWPAEYFLQRERLDRTGLAGSLKVATKPYRSRPREPVQPLIYGVPLWGLGPLTTCFG